MAASRCSILEPRRARDIRRGSRAVVCAWLLIAAIASCAAQISDRVNIRVAADQPEGIAGPVWNYFGYDEPNYSYAPNGRKLLAELAALSPEPVYVRVHNLFTSGDGSASLKWGSTNVYTEDAKGNPVYSWEIVDRIFDAFHEAGIKPLVELGFMPEALSTHPEPYRHNFPHGPVDSIYTGWAYPPKDYSKWSELVSQFVRHLVRRYGASEVKTWLWEVWNEPDIGYWKGTPEEYFKLYDYSVEAILRELPEAQIGGPDSTGPSSAKAAEFLRMFLEHCARGKNYATGKAGARLDFVSFHPKGRPQWAGDHVQMGLAHHLAAIESGFKIVTSFPEWRKTPVILGESDPEGCAACPARTNPQNAYRNGPLYACYEAELLDRTLGLAAAHAVHLRGAVTWAFEFEGQPYFEGFRTLATNGIDKPVLNAFRMFGLMGRQRVQATSSGALDLASVVRDGVRSRADIHVFATRKANEVEILVWNYHDDDVPAPPASIDLLVNGLPGKSGRARVEHFRVDSDHSNAYTVWKKEGSPQQPSAAQYQKIEAQGGLQLLSAPTWTGVKNNAVRLQFHLPRHAISLLRISW